MSSAVHRNQMIVTGRTCYLEAGQTYLPRLLNASTQVIETDIPALYPLDYDRVNALKKLMVMLCQSEPIVSE
ncbi:MAG: hypothetical protein CSA79_02995 [Thiothrix nivea]|nr:MAG: hypothetical protein CSA79_02995 [Thiothrix nivea]